MPPTSDLSPQRHWSQGPWSLPTARLTSRLKRGQWVKGPVCFLQLHCSLPGKDAVGYFWEQPGSVFKTQWSFSSYSSFCAWTDSCSDNFCFFLDRARWPLIWRYSLFCWKIPAISALRNFRTFSCFPLIVAGKFVSRYWNHYVYFLLISKISRTRNSILSWRNQEYFHVYFCCE